MVLVQIVALLCRLFKQACGAMIEAGELRRRMARHYPRMEE